MAATPKRSTAGVGAKKVPRTPQSPYGLVPKKANPAISQPSLPPPPPTVSQFSYTVQAGSGQTVTGPGPTIVLLNWDDVSTITITGTAANALWVVTPNVDWLSSNGSSRGTIPQNFGGSGALPPQSAYITVKPNADGPSRTGKIKVSWTYKYTFADRVGTWISAGPQETTINVYQPGFTPHITSLNHASGPQSGGTNMLITGTGFAGTSITLSTNGVKFGDAPTRDARASSATQISCASPASSVVGDVGVNVTVTVDGTSYTSNSATFTYTAVAPHVTSLDPPSGSTAGGTSVTIIGSNFS